MNLGCWPKPGAIGTLSEFTGVTVMQPLRLPPGKVAEFAATVSEKPGEEGSVRVPPTVSLTQSWWLKSRSFR
jgi:hypothetical protein